MWVEHGKTHSIHSQLMPGMGLAPLYSSLFGNLASCQSNFARPWRPWLRHRFVSEASFSFASLSTHVSCEFHQLVIPSSRRLLCCSPPVPGWPAAPCHGAQHPLGRPLGAGRPHSWTPWPWAAVFLAGQWRQVSQLTDSKECHEHLGQSNWLNQVFLVRCSPCVEKMINFQMCFPK